MNNQTKADSDVGITTIMALVITIVVFMALGYFIGSNINADLQKALLLDSEASQSI